MINVAKATTASASATSVTGVATVLNILPAIFGIAASLIGIVVTLRLYKLSKKKKMIEIETAQLQLDQLRGLNDGVD